MFKNDFFRKVCITQFILVIIICFLSIYINFVLEYIGFLLVLIFLIPYEFIYQEDFNEYISQEKLKDEKRKNMKD